jgi:hypothetical protein
MDQDHDIIRRALRLACRVGEKRRTNGGAALHRLAGEGLETLDRIEARSAQQLPLPLSPRDLSSRAHGLQMQATEIGRQAWRLEEQATAWMRAQTPAPLQAGTDAGDC